MTGIVVYKEDGDFPYEDIRRWEIRGDFVILYRSRRDVIIVPKESFSCVEIHPDPKEE